MKNVSVLFQYHCDVAPVMGFKRLEAVGNLKPRCCLSSLKENFGCKVLSSGTQR